MSRKVLSTVALMLGILSTIPACAADVKAAEKPEVVYAGIDYSPVYDYEYYISRHPRLKEKYGSNTKKALRHYVLYGYPKGEKGSWSATSAAFAKVRKERIARFLKKTKTGKLTSQIIVVCDHELSLWNRKADGSWKRKLRAYCGYGKNGMSENHVEGDKTTPIGSFPIMHAFGNAENPGTQMQWRDITPYSYWSEERDTYNTWVESREWMSGEHLADYPMYAYAMAVGYNVDPIVYNKGSAIFVHCKSEDRWYTGGCVSLRTNVMMKLLRFCKDGTYIIMVKRDSDVKKY